MRTRNRAGNVVNVIQQQADGTQVVTVSINRFTRDQHVVVMQAMGMWII